MRVLITGATGLLGSEVGRTLSRQGQALGWARRTPIGKTSFPIQSVDVTNGEAVARQIADFKPDLIVHTAALTDVDLCERNPQQAFRVNSEACRQIAQQCARGGRFLIAISTDYVFEGTSAAPYREEDSPRPVNRYGWSKLKGEQAVLQENPRTLVVRVSGLFGAARSNFVQEVAWGLRAGKKVQAVTDQVNSPSYTADLAVGIQRLVLEWQRDPSSVNPGGRLHGILHLANRGAASRLEVAQEVAKYVGAPESLIERTTWRQLSRPAQRPSNSRLDCTRFRLLMGYSLRGWSEALQAFLESTSRGSLSNQSRNVRFSPR